MKGAQAKANLNKLGLAGLPELIENISGTMATLQEHLKKTETAFDKTFKKLDKRIEKFDKNLKENNKTVEESSKNTNEFGHEVTHLGVAITRANKRTTIFNNTLKALSKNARPKKFELFSAKSILEYKKQGGSILEYFAEFLTSSREEIRILGFEAGKIRRAVFGFIPGGFRAISKIGFSLQLAGSSLRMLRDLTQKTGKEVEKTESKAQKAIKATLGLYKFQFKGQKRILGFFTENIKLISKKHRLQKNLHKSTMKSLKQEGKLQQKNSLITNAGFMLGRQNIGSDATPETFKEKLEGKTGTQSIKKFIPKIFMGIKSNISYLSSLAENMDSEILNNKLLYYDKLRELGKTQAEYETELNEQIEAKKLKNRIKSLYEVQVTERLNRMEERKDHKKLIKEQTKNLRTALKDRMDAEKKVEQLKLDRDKKLDSMPAGKEKRKEILKLQKRIKEAQKELALSENKVGKITREGTRKGITADEAFKIKGKADPIGRSFGAMLKGLTRGQNEAVKKQLKLIDSATDEQGEPLSYLAKARKKMELRFKTYKPLKRIKSISFNIGMIAKRVGMFFLGFLAFIAILFITLKLIGPTIMKAFEAAKTVFLFGLSMILPAVLTIWEGLQGLWNVVFGDGSITDFVNSLVTLTWGLLQLAAGLLITFGGTIITFALGIIGGLLVTLGEKFKALSTKGKLAVAAGAIVMVAAFILGAKVWLVALLGFVAYKFFKDIVKDGVKETVEKLKDAVLQVKILKGIKDRVSSGLSKVGEFLGIKEKARGGIVGLGETTLVGERGPELVKLPAGSRVYTNNQSKQMMGSTVNNFNITINAKDTSKEEMRRMADEIGRMVSTKINRRSSFRNLI
tara:strand:- start:40 stop:2607 length:2568 start_codon:yes stop_codon:yes gene_type:complete